MSEFCLLTKVPEVERAIRSFVACLIWHHGLAAYALAVARNSEEEFLQRQAPAGTDGDATHAKLRELYRSGQRLRKAFILAHQQTKLYAHSGLLMVADSSFPKAIRDTRTMCFGEAGVGVAVLAWYSPAILLSSWFVPQSLSLVRCSLELSQGDRLAGGCAAGQLRGMGHKRGRH